MRGVVLIAIFLTFLSGSELEKDSNSGVFESLMEDIVNLVSYKKDKDNNNSLPSVKHTSTNQNQQSTQTAQKTIEQNSSSHLRLKMGNDDEKKLLEKMGIFINDSKISIDTNRTKSFLDSLSKALKSSIHSGVKKASSQMPKEEDLGIKVENEKIEIDLNKTKNFMKKWFKAVEVFAKELNSTLKPFK